MSRAPHLAHPVFDRLRVATGLSDRQLELRLGMAEKGVYDSRRTGATPYRHIIQAVRAGVIACDLHWLFTGQEVRA